MNNYNPMIHGSVVAIRIYLKDGFQPMAELAFAFGGTKIISWVSVADRKKYEEGINGYTLFYDERPKAEFKDFVKPLY